MEPNADKRVKFHSGFGPSSSATAGGMMGGVSASKKDASDVAFLSGGGEMGERIRAFDWTRTALGPPGNWPQSLKTAVGILLNSGYPMYIAWGPTFVQIYNDAYRPILGDTKHPAALGANSEDTFAEIWPDIGPMFTSVIQESRPSTFTDLMLPLNRYGFPEECFFVFSYSPVLVEDGRSGGVFVTVLETTDRVLRERRQRTLKDLAAIHSQSARDEIFRAGVQAIAACSEDAPAVAICTRQDDRAWRIDAQSGPPTLSATALLDVLEQAQYASAPSTPLPLELPVVGSPWPEPIARVVCRPILPPGATEPAGYLVAALSPRLRWDQDYAAYFDMCALNLGAVIADAEAFAVQRQRAEALAEIDSAKTAFFSNVSHEFRTPLTLMLGPLEDALADTSSSALHPRQRDSLAAVHRNALRLQKLVNSLLDFSRIEAGRAKASFEPTDLAAFTTDLVSSFRSATDKAGLTLSVDAAPLPQPIYVDRDMWENIVLNLISNAFKFTLEGEIRVEIRPTPEGHSVSIVVRDTGVGIPAHELPNLFDRFHRVEGVVGRSIEGSGIGLALVRELVTLHGGDLAVESTVAAGTTFTITLPYGCEHLPPERVNTRHEPAIVGHRHGGFVAEALRWLPTGQGGALTAEVEARPADGKVAPQHRILVVDDNADMRDYLRHLLEGRGHIVELAQDGLAALKMIQCSPPDLVLSDLMMPNLDGFGLLAELRNTETTKELPFIALSARAGEEAKIEGLEAGADDYLVKPFSSRELFARVESALQLAQVRRAAQRELRTEYARLQQLFEQAPSFMASVRGPSHVFEFANEAYQRLVGHRDLIGKPVVEVLPEVQGQGFLELLDNVYRTGEPFLAENAVVQLRPAPDAPLQEHFVNFIYEALTEPDGTIVGVFVEGQDVTAHHKAKQHLELVIGELNHRVKNMLAIVQSISHQTFKGAQPSEVERKAFEGRLAALSSAHDLLSSQNWDSPTLEAVATKALAAHIGDGAIAINGPLVQLTPKTAVTLAMALHELCTNAVKYGALSQPGGSVALTWTIQAEQDGRLRVLWREAGGPSVSPPKHQGFGSRLIERALATELQGTVSLHFPRDGLVCEIDAPIPRA